MSRGADFSIKKNSREIKERLNNSRTAGGKDKQNKVSLSLPLSVCKFI